MYCAPGLGLYRPTYDSKMKSGGSTPGVVPWWQINTEQLITQFYANMLFPDGPPQNTPVSATQGDQVTLQPQLPPNQTTFKYTWMIDVNNDGTGGNPICGGNGTGPLQCAIDTTSLPAGDHIVQVSIQDATASVKSPAQQAAVTKQLMWVLSVAACPVQEVIDYSQSAPYPVQVSQYMSDGQYGYVVEQCTDTDEIDNYYDCKGDLVDTVDKGAVSTSSQDCSQSGPFDYEYGPYDATDYSCPSNTTSCTDYYDEYDFVCPDEDTYEEYIFDYTGCACSIITYTSQTKPALRRVLRKKVK
jgi:hypothetical protein